MKSRMFLEEVTSKPVVGSSKSRIGGSASKALAKASFLFMPPEYFWKTLKRLVLQPHQLQNLHDSLVPAASGDIVYGGEKFQVAVAA